MARDSTPSRRGSGLNTDKGCKRTGQLPTKNSTGTASTWRAPRGPRLSHPPPLSKQPTLPSKRPSPSLDPHLLLRQRDELRIRIQHLLHLLHDSEETNKAQEHELVVLRHALSSSQRINDETLELHSKSFGQEKSLTKRVYSMFLNG